LSTPVTILRLNYHETCCRCPQPSDGANISNSVQHIVIWYDESIVGWGICPWEVPDGDERWLVFTLLNEWIAMPEHQICLYEG
jgi:hypothetical protein